MFPILKQKLLPFTCPQGCFEHQHQQLFITGNYLLPSINLNKLLHALKIKDTDVSQMRGFSKTNPAVTLTSV
jgi:hypothetical protein